AEDGIRDFHVTGVQTCALPIFLTGGGDQEDRASGSPMLIYEGGGFRVHIWVDELMQGLSDDLPDLVDPPSPTQLGEVVPDAGHRTEERRVGAQCQYEAASGHSA